MAQLEGTLEAGAEAPSMGGGNNLPVSGPEGFLVKIIKDENKMNSKGTGSMLCLRLQIQDGIHAGVEGDWNLNLGHSDATTVRIAQNTLRCVMHAVGQTGAIQNTDVLHHRPFRVLVDYQKKNREQAIEKGYTEVTDILRADGSKLSDPPGSSGAPGQAPGVAATPPGAPAPAQPQAGNAFPPTNPPATPQPQGQPNQFPQSTAVQPNPPQQPQHQINPPVQQPPAQQPGPPQPPQQGGVPSWSQPPGQ